MAKKTEKAGDGSKMVKVLCRATVMLDDATYLPETMIEVSLVVAEELEEGGFVERVFDVVVDPENTTQGTGPLAEGQLVGALTQGGDDTENTGSGNAES